MTSLYDAQPEVNFGNPRLIQKILEVDLGFNPDCSLGIAKDVKWLNYNPSAFEDSVRDSFCSSRDAFEYFAEIQELSLELKFYESRARKGELVTGVFKFLESLG